MVDTTWDYSENTPEINFLAEKMSENSKIDPALYGKYDVKRGLRDIDGKGVLTGLTDISTIKQNKLVDGKLVPCEGELYYRGYNVNDIVNGADAETLCGNLKRTVLLLREAGCRIILLTPVPFEYAGTQRAVWDAVCYYCEEELSRLVCEVIRTDGFLSLSPEEPYRAKYGAHPDAEGHREIASRVIDALSRQFRKT